MIEDVEYIYIYISTFSSITPGHNPDFNPQKTAPGPKMEFSPQKVASPNARYVSIFMKCSDVETAFCISYF